MTSASRKTTGTRAAWKACRPPVIAAHVAAGGEERLDRAEHRQPERPGGRAPVRPGTGERGEAREDVEQVDECAQILVRVQPARLSEDEAPDQVDLDEHADDCRGPEDEGAQSPRRCLSTCMALKRAPDEVKHVRFAA